MAAHSAALSASSKADSSPRRLRTRVPRSNLLQQFAVSSQYHFSLESPKQFDEAEYFGSPKNGLHNDKDRTSPRDFEENSLTIDPLSQSASKSTRRLNISRHPRVSTPPPLPAPDLPYIQPDKFPAWLLGDPMAKSSAKYVSSRKDLDMPQRSSSASHTQQHNPSSPVRRAASPLLASSPFKFNHLQNSLSRQSSSCHLDFRRRSISPDDALDRRREKFWELYEYDSASPHLQSKYFDKPLPTNEQWSDLDIQNVSLIPEPKPGTAAIHLFEVFAPSTLPEPSHPNSSLTHVDTHSAQSLHNKSAQHEKVASIPFGFNFLHSADSAVNK
ncbi:uncharacterized protein VP01_1228g10 [Puccinia sorghi]|uniref:Uncharacterized protein n=1 Tax=Puccinia sorghi TaxID=27349 RepID=A0A0L6VRC5_9BASI|nr:uncharacterized protein VP01_1228g10 [Puccinia sorghi]